MLSAAEQDFVSGRAYVPEHVTGYVCAISSVEPFLVDECLCYRRDDAIVFIGFPLGGRSGENRTAHALSAAITRFAPAAVAVTAPSLSALGALCLAAGTDRYYRLDLATHRPSVKVEATVRRAARELEVARDARFDDEHRRLIAEFTATRALGEETRAIFERIPDYVASASSATLLDARDRRGHLAGFTVGEFGARDYAFYQFSFISRRRYVPGTADLLLHELIGAAHCRDKRYVNLGLGVNEGLTRFKLKWGAAPFLDYACCRYRLRPPSVLDALLGRP